MIKKITVDEETKHLKYDEKEATHGGAAFTAYAKARKLPKIERDQDYSITDCVADLMHYAISRGFDPEDLLRSAGNHLDAETQIVENCAKCGSPISQADLEEGEACSDEGTGQEAGSTFYYCSQDCLERH